MKLLRQALWVFILALAWLGSPLARAQGLILGISEGTSGGLDHAQVIAKYKGMSDLIATALKTKVSVVFAREFGQLEEGMHSGRFDFVFARPSDYPARGLRDYGYQYVASAKPEGQCFIIVPKGSAIQSLAQAKGKRIVMPEQIAYMSRFCNAALRDQGITLAQEKVQYVREQAAVGFFLENGFADVGGVASYSGIAKKWEKDGHRILYKSPAQPYFPLVANAQIKPDQIRAVQKELLAMGDSETGRDTLKTIGVQQFDTSTEPRMRELLKWLGQ